MSVTITADHLTLLSQLDFDWDDNAEYGCVSSDPKRPFGNVDVEGDIAEILGREVGRDEAKRLAVELSALVNMALEQSVKWGLLSVGDELALPWRAERLLR